MERLRSLIKEVLTVQPKKDCNCGCGGCAKKSPIITEGRIKKAISEGLTYHVENKIPLHKSVYRIGSEKHFALINEARKLWVRGLIDVSEDDQAILETHLGNFGLYETVNFEGEEYDIVSKDGDWVYLRSIHDTQVGRKEIKVKEKDITINEAEVPLDMPMVNEEKDRAKEIMNDLFGYDFEFDYTYKPEGNKIVIDAEGYNDDGTLFDMKDVHKEKIIRTFQDKMPNADAKPNMGGGITVHLKESVNEVEIGDTVKIDKNYGGGRGVVDDKVGSYVIINGKSYHESDVKVINSVNEEKEYYVTYNKGRGQGKGLVKSKESNYEEPRVFSKEEAEEYAKEAESRSRQMTAYWVSDKDMNRLEESLNENNLLRQTNLSSEEYQKAKKLKGFNSDDYKWNSDENLYVKKESLDEAKKKAKSKKKDPPLNKPKRGGSKAYYVYVRDPKTKKIKKVSFGSGGLRAKIKNKEARNAFAARHNCKNKKDRTKAGYWSCNLPRYAEQLGLGSNMNTFW